MGRTCFAPNMLADMDELEGPVLKTPVPQVVGRMFQPARGPLWPLWRLRWTFGKRCCSSPNRRLLPYDLHDNHHL